MWHSLLPEGPEGIEEGDGDSVPGTPQPRYGVEPLLGADLVLGNGLVASASKKRSSHESPAKLYE